MMAKIFNSEIELATRFLLILREIENISISKLIGYDFMCTYGNDFNISTANLHGENDLRYSELTAKRDIAKISIKFLLGYGYINVNNTSYGYTYSVTDKGKKFCDKLNDDYSEKYSMLIKEVGESYSRLSDTTLLKYISNHALKKIGGVEVE